MKPCLRILLLVLIYFSFSPTNAQTLTHIKQIWSNSGIPTIEEISMLNENKVWLIRLIPDVVGEADIYVENEIIVHAEDSDDFFIQLLLFTDDENNYIDHLLLDSGKLIHHIKSYDNELYAVERNALFAGKYTEKVIKWNEALVKSDVFIFENTEWNLRIQDYIYENDHLTLTGSFNGKHIVIYGDSLFNDYTDPIITNPAVERTGYIYKLNLTAEDVLFKSNFGTRQFAESKSLFSDKEGNYYCTGEYSFGDLNMQGQSINWEGFNSQSDIFCFKINSTGVLSYLTGISTEGYILHEQVACSEDGETTLALYSSAGYLVIDDNLTLQNNNNNDRFIVNLDTQGSYQWHSVIGSDIRVSAIHQEEELLKILGWNNQTTSSGTFPYTYNDEELDQYNMFSAYIFEINSTDGHLIDHWLVDQENHYEILKYEKVLDTEHVVVKFRQDFISVDGYEKAKLTTDNQVQVIANLDSKLLSLDHNTDRDKLLIYPTIIGENTTIKIENSKLMHNTPYEIYNNMGVILETGKVQDGAIKINSLHEAGLKYLLLKDPESPLIYKLMYINN